jgi:hypothetical protein
MLGGDGHSPAIAYLGRERHSSQTTASGSSIEGSTFPGCLILSSSVKPICILPREAIAGRFLQRAAIIPMPVVVAYRSLKEDIHVGWLYVVSVSSPGSCKKSGHSAIAMTIRTLYKGNFATVWYVRRHLYVMRAPMKERVEMRLSTWRLAGTPCRSSMKIMMVICH